MGGFRRLRSQRIRTPERREIHRRQVLSLLQLSHSNKRTFSQQKTTKEKHKHTKQNQQTKQNKTNSFLHPFYSSHFFLQLRPSSSRRLPLLSSASKASESKKMMRASRAFAGGLRGSKADVFFGGFWFVLVFDVFFGGFYDPIVVLAV